MSLISSKVVKTTANRAANFDAVMVDAIPVKPTISLNSTVAFGYISAIGPFS